MLQSGLTAKIKLHYLMFYVKIHLYCQLKMTTGGCTAKERAILTSGDAIDLEYLHKLSSYQLCTPSPSVGDYS